MPLTQYQTKLVAKSINVTRSGKPAALMEQGENTNLDVLGELLVVLFVVVLVLGEFSEELQALLDQVLADDLQDLALLQHLSGDVQGQILRVHHTLDEI